MVKQKEFLKNNLSLFNDSRMCKQDYNINILVVCTRCIISIAVGLYEYPFISEFGDTKNKISKKIKNIIV